LTVGGRPPPFGWYFNSRAEAYALLKALRLGGRKHKESRLMGANSKQGWCLLIFLIGFTFLLAGLIYLGPIFTLIGLGFLIGSVIGFYRIKPLEHAAQAASIASAPMSTPPSAKSRGAA
jgi:hypothetical protein